MCLSAYFEYTLTNPTPSDLLHSESYQCIKCLPASTLQATLYRIAGYFQGTKFSRIAQTKHFRTFYFRG